MRRTTPSHCQLLAAPSRPTQRVPGAKFSTIAFVPRGEGTGGEVLGSSKIGPILSTTFLAVYLGLRSEL
jgi:hypothetical protein